jgi:hypothetical protein
VNESLLEIGFCWCHPIPFCSQNLYYNHLGESTSLLATEDSYEAMQTNEGLQNDEEPHNQPGIYSANREIYCLIHVSSYIRELLTFYLFYRQL